MANAASAHAAPRLEDRPSQRADPRPARWRGKPLVGALPEFRADALGTLERMAELGSPVRFYLLHQRLHLLTEPAHVEHVLVSGARYFGKQTVGYRRMRRVVGMGLLTAEGAFWRRQRRIAQPAFRKPRIDGFGQIMTEAAEAMVERWEDGAQIDLAREMMAVTLRVVGLTLLSRDVSSNADEVGEALTVGLEHIMYRMQTPWAPPEWVPTDRNRTFRAAVHTLDRVVRGIVSERREAGAEGGGGERPEDLLDIFMSARDPETGEGMSDEQLRDEVMTMFLAGHETTAMTLAWTFDLLARHPEVEARLRGELACLEGRTPTIADLPKLPYGERVLLEAMRLYPPAWLLGRSASEANDLGGYPIRAGDWVFISPWLTHRRPHIWPEPERFDPDRFAPQRAAGRHRYAYFPFAGGQRKCIGDRFAMVEARLILATVLQRARLEPRYDGPLEPDPLVTLRPRGDMPMRVSRLEA
jgi:cytochrome P450